MNIPGDPNRLHPNRLLDRKQVSEALTLAGYRISMSTLATMVTRGGGPPYRLFGRLPLYRWSDALAWAESRMSPPRHRSIRAAEEAP